MTLLIVEDDAFFAQRLKEFLEDRSFQILCARSVEDAIAVPFDKITAVLADVMLPNDPAKSNIPDIETRSGFISGIALFRHLRKRGVNVPVILFSGVDMRSEAGAWAAKEGVPLVAKENGPSAVVAALEHAGINGKKLPPRAFIVHGHDEHALADLKDYLQNTLKWAEPVVLRDQPNLGRTIIEKFEDLVGRIDCVFVLLTPDDKGVDLTTDDAKRRARQNVIFELGFFYAHLGRRSGRIIALRHGPIDLPSDIQGIVWIDISRGVKAAGEEIRKEVEHIVR